MKKLSLRKFLFMLLAVLLPAMANADNVAKIGSTEYATIQAAFDAATDGQTITLLADYDASTENNGNYSGQRNLWLAKGVIVDGDNHTLTVTNRGIGVQGASSNIDVTFKNITISNSNAAGRCIDTRGKISSLTLENVTLTTAAATSKNYDQPLTIGGNQATAMQLVIKNSTIETSVDGSAYYAIITFNPVNATVENSTLRGWACIYAREASSSAGSAGSVWNIKGSKLYSTNKYNGTSNSFSAIMINDENVTVNFENSELHIDATQSDQSQAIASFSQKSNCEVVLGNGNTIDLEGEGATYALNLGTSEVEVQAGTTSNVEIPEELCADGYIPTDNGDGTYGVKVGTYVAQIGNVKYETLAEAVAAVPTDGTATTITMIADETITGNVGVTIAATQNVVLELNGHTISQTGPMAGASYLIKNNGTLTLQDATDTNADGTGTGKMLCTAEDPDTGDIPSYATNLISNYGNLTILSGYYQTLTDNGYASYVVDNYSGGTANITGGKLCNSASYAYVVRQFLNSTTKDNILNISGTAVIAGSYSVWVQTPNANANKGTLNITGGTLSATDGAALYVGGTKANNSNISINVTDGTIGGTGVIIQGPLSGTYGSVSISGGEITNVLCGANVEDFISGGTFSQPVNEAYCADGYIPTDNGDGTYGVDGPYAAKIGSVGYATLQAAVDAATAGQTITLLQDIDLTTVTTTPNNKYNVNVNKSITIDGDGHTITSSNGKCALALTGEGNNITLKNLTVVNNHADWGVGILNALTCTLDNTTIDGTNYSGSYNQPLTIGSISDAGRVTLNVVNGSVIKTNDAGTAHYAIIAWHPADITVTNSSLIGWANVYIKPDAEGSTVNISNSTLKSQGLSGATNNFAMITTESGNNTITLTDNNITLNAVNGTYMALTSLSDSGNSVTVQGDQTTFTTNSATYGGIVYNVGDLDGNTVALDESVHTLMADEIAVLVPQGVTDTESSGTYTLGYVAEVYYYWYASGVEDGVKCSFAEPFTNGWLSDGEYIRLQKDVTLTADINCALTSGSFTLTQGTYGITKGNYSVTLKNGVSVVTDKQTDIFTAEDATNYKVTETEDNGTYTYTVTAVPNEIILNDGDAYTISADVDGVTATYVRSFASNRVNKYQGWLVPFNYTITAGDLEKFKFFQINMIAHTAKEGETEDASKLWIHLIKMEEGDVLKANKPYIFTPLEEMTDYEFTSTNATLKAATSEAIADCSTLSEKFDFYGVYTSANMASVGGEFYYMSLNGQISRATKATTTVGANRWIFTVTSKDGSQTNVTYSPTFNFVVDGDDYDDVTAVSSATDAGVAEGDIVGYYTLSGQKVSEPTKGVYVVKYANGKSKKVVF